MSRSLTDVLDDIERFVPPADGSWLALDALLREAFDSRPNLTPAIGPLLRIFERFPRHDGFEVFWSIIHFLEHVGGYETALVESVRRYPTEMGVTMLRRILNSGVEHVGGVALAPLIQWGEEHAPGIDYSLEP